MTSKDMHEIEIGLVKAAKQYTEPKTTVVKQDHKDRLSGRSLVRRKVLLSVRRMGKGGGPEGVCLRYEYDSSDLSAIGSEHDAKLAARKAGYVYWVTLDNQQV